MANEVASSMLLTAVLAMSATNGEAQGRAGFVEVAGGDSLYYEVEGAGLPVVLLHDGTFGLVVWDRQVEALSQRYRVTRYDRRGYGKSTRPDTVYSNVDDLHALLGEVGVDHAVLVGSSTGGRVAAEYAVRHPGAVVGLVLVGSVVPGLQHLPGFVEDAWSRVAPLLNEQRTAIIDPVTEEARSEVVRRFVSDPHFVSPQSPEAKEWVREGLRAHFDNIFNPIRWMEWLDPPLRHRLGELRVPTLVLVGEDDHPELHASAGALHISITESVRQIVPKAAHLPQVEQPDVFNRILLEFLEREVRDGFDGAF